VSSRVAMEALYKIVLVRHLAESLDQVSSSQNAERILRHNNKSFAKNVSVTTLSIEFT